MKRRCIPLFIAVLLGWSLTPIVAVSQANDIAAQMDLVVKLRIHRTMQATEETAAAIFVGKDQANAYFITACHAVTQKDKDDNLIGVHSVLLQFHNSPQRFKATVFDRYNQDLDLAVVEFPVSNLPAGLHEVIRKDAGLGVPIHVIGHPSAGDWTIAVGAVIGISKPDGGIHHFIVSRDNALAEGHSGGAAFDAQGALLGMHTSSGPTYGIEAKSSEIVDQLAAWRVPTNNLLTTLPDSGKDGLQADQDAINGVIDAYVDSYQRKDAQALWKIWPNPPAKTKTAIESYFRSARSISMRLSDRRVQTNGTSATVVGQFWQEFTPSSGSAQRSPESPITFELEKRNGAWLIMSVR